MARAGFRIVTWLVVAAIALAANAAWAAKGIDGVVNLNTAPPEVLGLLPGIGPAKAAEIVRYRTKRPFRTVDELVRIKGIGRKMVRRFRTHLAVAGPTTAAGVSTVAAVPSQPPPPPPKPASIVKPGALCRIPLTARPRVRVAQRWPTHSACARSRLPSLAAVGVDGGGW